MPRPCKRRRICALPRCCHFGPSRQDNTVVPVITMSLDEFEAIRLIDLEGLSQEECAAQMDVARTTAQAIYTCARSKLAECLVHGKELSIEGGNYLLCNGQKSRDTCTAQCGRCCHEEQESKELI